MVLIRLLRRRIKIIIACISVILALYLGLSVLGAAATMQLPRLPVNVSPASVGLTFQDVAFAARIDAIDLKGWFLPSSGDSVLIIIPGGFENRVDPQVDTINLAKDLVQKGYNILLFDLRGRGESGGKGLSLSNENRDIGGAVDYTKTRGYPVGKIGIIGFCSGAADACIFTSQETDIGGLVLDGCFSKVEDMFYNQASKYGIPRLPVDIFVPSIKLAARVFYGYSEINPIDVVGKVQCPIFFIHEGNDDLVSIADTKALFQASNRQINILWEVDDITHVHAYHAYPEEYVKRVNEFFATALHSTIQSGLPAQ